MGLGLVGVTEAPSHTFTAFKMGDVMDGVGGSILFLLTRVNFDHARTLGQLQMAFTVGSFDALGFHDETNLLSRIGQEKPFFREA
jgi:hypothetical protein